MRQDKFVELRIAQLHWNAVPRLAFGHLDPESIEILADSPHIDKRQTCKGFQTNSRAGKTCNQLLMNFPFSTFMPSIPTAHASSQGCHAW